MRPYEYVFIDEAYQVSDLNFFPFINSITFSSIPYETIWPLIWFIADPYQLKPTTRAIIPAPYYLTKEIIFLRT